MDAIAGDNGTRRCAGRVRHRLAGGKPELSYRRELFGEGEGVSGDSEEENDDGEEELYDGFGLHRLFE